MAAVQPLKTVQELFSWEVNNVHVQIKEALSSKSKFYCNKQIIDRPQTLLCHDMMGGYREDSYLDGCSASEAYQFVHWTCIDWFVYFSHHFVTIPPFGWIAAAHRNGVPVLGTLITEHDAGRARCKQLFSSMDNVDKAVAQLTKIAELFNLQGWLINIENNIERSTLGNVLAFLGKLKQSVKRSDPSSVVVWYDSIVHPWGMLCWQNKLNDFNRCFYEASDFIFLNYSWTVDDLITSKSFAASHAPSPSSLLKNFCLLSKVGGSSELVVTKPEFRVFVGVDVFGRNFYEGGGFNTHKAVKVIERLGLSCAIFAPGWTYEKFGHRNFYDNDSKFWTSLYPYLHTHGPHSWPIHTCFSQGCRSAQYKRGHVVLADKWFNLAQQDLLPELFNVHDGLTARLCCSDGYEGNGCLQLSNFSCAQQTANLWRNCLLPCAAGEVLLVRITYKLQSDASSVFLRLVATIMHTEKYCSKLVLNFTTARESSNSSATCGWVTTTDSVAIRDCIIVHEIAVCLPPTLHIMLGELDVRPQQPDNLMNSYSFGD